MKDDNDNIILKRSHFNKLVIVAVVALMVASFLAGYIFGGGVETGTSIQGGSTSQRQSFSTGFQPSQLQPAPVKISSISLDSSHTLGRPGAAMTLVEFSDFQCPFCERFFTNTLPQIQKTYVDTGKLKLVYKHFPLTDLHPNAREAASAAECANEQGKFWPYHNTLFSNQAQWAHQYATQVASTFQKYASSLGLNSVTFNSCLDSHKYSSTIDKDLQQASAYGISSTPTFYVGNDKNGYTQIVGSKSFSIFQLTIDQLLSQQH